MRSAMLSFEDRMEISERIREIRLNAELIQYEFGERLGVGRVTCLLYTSDAADDCCRV